MSQSRQLAAIMFTDIVGYTAMMQQDKEMAVDAVLKSETVLKKKIEQHDGELLQIYGDGSLSIFNNVTGAVSCATQIQEDLRDQVPLRIGIHIGEITRDHDHFFGDGVNIASRIESLGISGSILVSANVYQQLINNARFQFTSLGYFNLKNVKQPIEVFAVSNQGFPIPEGKVPDQPTSKVRPTSTKVQRRIFIGSLGVLLAVIIVGFTEGWFRFKEKLGPATGKSIAVLPFDNMSNDPEQEYFSDGMAEEIINALVQIPNLKVTSRTSSFQFREEQNIKSIGDALGVATILEGSVRKSGNRVRVTAQLINVSDGFHLWSQTYERELTDIFAVQDELSRSIVDALHMQIAEIGPLVTVQTTNMEAYNLYLKGQYYNNLRSQESLNLSIEYFEKAISIDSTYALAYHGLAASYMALGAWGYQPASKTLEKAKSAVLRSLELDGTVGKSYAVLGGLQMWYEWDWEAARNSFNRCFQLTPNYVQGHIWRFNLAAVTGDTLTMTKEINIAKTIDPAYPPANWAMARYYAFRGEYQKALEQAQKTPILQADPAPLHLTMYQIHKELGQEDASFQHFLQWRSAFGEEVRILEADYQEFGWQRAAEKMLILLEGKSKSNYIDPLHLALYAVHAEDFDKAMNYLEQAYDQKVPLLTSIGLETHWKPLYSNPRFKRLLSKMELSPAWAEYTAK